MVRGRIVLAVHSRNPHRAMWCSTCQQDVPSLGSPQNEGNLRCGKCGQILAAGLQPESSIARAAGRMAADPDASLEGFLRAAPLADDDWALEAELRGVERLVRALQPGGSTTLQPTAIDQPHRQQAGWHVATSESTAAADEKRRAAQGADPSRSALQLAALSSLAVGLALFACGAVLLGWSLIGKRPDLWPVGMPLALVGQAGLILGLILQLDGLWHSNRKTAEALDELDGELMRVRQATTLLSTSRSSGAQTFYAHLAEGASPQLLLADLKGQLDLLAQQMASQR